MSVADIMILQALFGLAVVRLRIPLGLPGRSARPSPVARSSAPRCRSSAGSPIRARPASPPSRWPRCCSGPAPPSCRAPTARCSGPRSARAGRHGEYPRWEGRLRGASQTSEAVSAAAGGWLYTLSPRLPFWLQVPTAVAGARHGRRAPRDAAPTRRRAPLARSRRAWHLVGFTLWRHRRLQAAMALSVALGLASFVMVWLIQPYLQLRGVPAGVVRSASGPVRTCGWPACRW